jgi:hypothetical protein
MAYKEEVLFTAAEGKDHALKGGEIVLVIITFLIVEGPRRMARFGTRRRGRSFLQEKWILEG